MAGLFNYRAERAFAEQLAQKIQAQLPPEALLGDALGKLSVNKVTRLLEQVYQDAVSHFSDKKPGLLRRSIFANAFKWELSSRKYPQNFIDVATEGLVMELMKAKKASVLK